MTLIEDFRKELRILQSGVTKSDLPLKDCFKKIQHKNKSLSFPKKIASSHVRAIRILRLKARNLRKFISDKELEHLLDDFLFDLKYGDESKFMGEVDKNVVCLFDSLRKMQSQKHLFIVPIMGLSVVQDIAIGGAKIVNLTEQALGSLESTYSVKLGFKGESLSEIVERMTKSNETTFYAIVVVDAPDDEKALELALQKADACLNVLRLYYYNAQFALRDECRKLILREIVDVNLDTKIHGLSLSSINVVANIPIVDSNALSQMKKAGFDMIDKLLSKEADQMTKLQENILTAIFWFGNAVKEEQRNMKFLKSIIALETLLIPDGGQGKAKLISKRYASLVYASASDEEKKEVYRTMRSLYEIRNSVIHSGEGYVYDDDLAQVMHWTRAAILILLTYAEKFSDVTELCKKRFPVDDSLYVAL